MFTNIPSTGKKKTVQYKAKKTIELKPAKSLSKLKESHKTA
jgi:hypothetical protein